MLMLYAALNEKQKRIMARVGKNFADPWFKL